MNIIEYFQEINIIQIGCGGTGGWLVPLISKLVNNINLRLPVTTHRICYNIVDFDIVEERNILRQNFNAWDIGKLKTQALVNRCVLDTNLIASKNIKIKSKSDFIPFANSYEINIRSEGNEDIKRLLIIIGCVDNNKTRQKIYSFLDDYPRLFAYRMQSDVYSNTNSLIYIDSGNSLDNGQIVTLWKYFDDIDVKNKNQEQINFKKKFPTREKNNNEETASCAFFGEQSQGVNNFAASIIFLNLQNILINNEFPPNLIEFNSNGYSHFKI